MAYEKNKFKEDADYYVCINCADCCGSCVGCGNLLHPFLDRYGIQQL